MIALLLTLAIVTASQRTIDVHVDLIEVNRTYNPSGHCCFEQIILWERMPSTGRMKVRSWRMADGNYPTTANGITRYDYEENGTTYRIRSGVYRESWTSVDPEREDLKVHPGERHALPKRATP